MSSEGRRPQHVEERLQLIRLALVVYRQRKVIALVSFACATLALLISLLLPKFYDSTATVVAIEEKGKSIGSVVALSQLTESLAGAGLPTFTATRDLFMNVLRSRSLAEAVVQNCDLREFFELESMERTVDRLRSCTDVYSSKEGLISVTVRVSDPDLAARIANSHVEALDRIVTEKRVSDAGRQRRFISKRLEQATEELGKAEESFRAFQEEHNLLSLEYQVAGVSTAAQALATEIRSLEATLSARTLVLAEDNPLSRKLRRLIDEKKHQLAGLQGGTQLLSRGDPEIQQANAEGNGEIGSTPIPSAFHASSDLPALQLQLQRLTRDVILKANIYSILVEELERAAISETRDEPTVQRLDAAIPAERPAGPRVLLISAVSLLAGFVLSLSGVVIADYFRESRELWRGRLGEGGQSKSERESG